jgi:hypothetical protein
MRRPFGGASFRFSEECLEPFVVRQHRIVMAELAVDSNVTVNQIGEPVTPSKPLAADSSTASGNQLADVLRKLPERQRMADAAALVAPVSASVAGSVSRCSGGSASRFRPRRKGPT